MRISRRRFLAAAASSAALGMRAGATAPAARPDSRVRGVQIGVITYSFRELPDQSAAAMLRYCLECGISAIELMGEPAEAYAGLPAEARERPQIAAWREHAGMEKFAQLRRMYNAAGVRIYAFKPSAFEPGASNAEVDYGMRAARALGASHVTSELPEDIGLAQRLGDAAAAHGLRMAYHAHTQATPTAWDAALAASRGNAINLDLGHFTAAGDFDGVAFVRRHQARIASMHLKDRRTKTRGGENVPWGEGDTPLAQVLRLMRDQHYAFPATIELEYPVPAGSDAVREVSRCLAFCREALAAPA
jgi:sugar phosphate isomerase/epimerase